MATIVLIDFRRRFLQNLTLHINGANTINTIKDTIKGQALFRVQFAGDDQPFDSWDTITKWTADCGYKWVQALSWMRD